MPRPLRAFDTPVLHDQSGDGDPQSVGQNRNWNRDQGQQDSNSGSCFRQISVNDSQRDQRKQRPDSATRFGHLQPSGGQKNDVAFAHRWNCQSPVNRKVAVLEARIWSGKVIWSTKVDEGIIKIRNARGNEIAARCFHPARKHHHPADQKKKRDAGEEKSGADRAQHQRHQREYQDDQAPPRWFNRKRRQLFAAFPDQEQRKHRNKKSVSVIRILPPLLRQLQ